MNKNIFQLCFRIKYLDATKLRRDNFTLLFITTLKPYKPISKGTETRWIKTTLAAADIDVKLFTPHSTHSASNSKAKLHEPIETILKTEGGAVCIHFQNIMINEYVRKMNLHIF